VIDGLLKRVLLPRIVRLVLALCSVLAGGLLFTGTQALAVDGSGQSAGEAPVIATVSVSNVTEHDATLEAQIETNGRYTGYAFQIDTNGSYNLEGPVCPFEFPGYDECDSIRAGEPLPTGLVEPQPQYIPAGSGDQAVSLDLASIGATLQSATTYHYRVIASSGGPILRGPDQTLTTVPENTAPKTLEEPMSSSSHGDQPTSSPIVAVVTPVVIPTTPVMTTTATKLKVARSALKLEKALQACARKPKKQRAMCEHQARGKYASTAKKR
jgi:hypothetical protein